MHIGLIGGLDRNETLYTQIAAREGHLLSVHTGDMSGRRSQILDAVIARCEVVIIITDVNSHAAVWRARQLSKTRGIPCMVMKRCGVSRFAAIAKDLRMNAPKIAEAR